MVFFWFQRTGGYVETGFNVPPPPGKLKLVSTYPPSGMLKGGWYAETATPALVCLSVIDKKWA